MITGDFETRSAADLIKWGAQRYAVDETTQALCFCWQYDEEPIDGPVHLWHRGHPWIEETPYNDEIDELIRRIEDGEPFEAHNALFEFVIWNGPFLKEFPHFRVKLKLEQLHCSAAKASCVSAPRGLGDATKAFRLSQRKDADGKRLINKLSKPLPRRKSNPTIRFSEDEADHRRNWDYCKQDVRSERSLSDFLPPMSDREREYWIMDAEMNLRGVNLDLEAVDTALMLADEETARLNAELYELTGGAVEKFSKRAPLLEWVNGRLRELGATPIENTKADTFSFALHGVPTKAGEAAKLASKPAADAKWEALGDDGAIVKRVIEIAMEGNKSSVAKFRRMRDSVCPDNRLHDLMLYNGADRTGRWSGKGVQPHNFVRGYSKEMPSVWEDIFSLDAEYITIIWGPVMGALAKAARGALCASEGKELYAADFNAIEARKLAWMSGCSRLISLFQTGGDPYIDMACGIYNLPIPVGKEAIDAFKKEHKDERNLGKKAILGLGYAMGWEKFQMTVWMDEGIWLDDDFCKEVVRIYRRDRYPEIPKLWKGAEDAAIRAVVDGGEWSCGGDELGIGSVSYFVEGRFLHCRLPSGRLLAYLDPEVHYRINYRFPAINARGGETFVTFPAKKRVPQNRVRWHAEKLAEKQGKRLTGAAPESFERPHLSFMGRDTYTRQWKRCGTHGGTLVENFDQASSRDLLAESMKRVDELPEFDLLLSIHDEVIAEAERGTCSVKEFESIMAEVPHWAPGMPISAEGWVGPRLRK